jgi:hypothetical protein
MYKKSNPDQKMKRDIIKILNQTASKSKITPSKNNGFKLKFENNPNWLIKSLYV